MTDRNIKHPNLHMTMSLHYLATQLDQLEAFGFDRARALEVLELSEAAFEMPQNRIEAERVEQMYQHAAKVLSDPRIAIRVGYRFRVPEFGKTGSIYSHADNMMQVFDLNRKYQCLSVDIGVSEHRIEEGRHFFLYNRYEDAKHMHHVMGAILGSWATALRWLSWAAGHELKEVHLMPNAPDDDSFYREIVQCPVYFGKPRNHVELHPESVTKPLITSDPEKLARSIAILDKLLDSGDEAENFKRSVQASIKAAMAEGAANFTNVARRMEIPERRLRQKMRDTNLSFRDMLEGERKKLFRQLHAKGESFASIAQSLAYNDQAAFTRAFKRWYGVSPGTYKGETLRRSE